MACCATVAAAHPLDSCDFDLDLEIDPSDLPAVERQGNSCIRRALRRQVLELRFRVHVPFTPRLPFTLSDRPLASEHLTRLELSGVQGNSDVLDFSWCPSLEELKMAECQIGSLEMYSPSVKHLSIKYCLFYSNYRTRLSFPNLVSFKLMKNIGRAPLLESMPLLETAKVSFDSLCHDRCRNGHTDDDCEDGACDGCYYYYGTDDNNCVFLQGLKEATCLYLSACPEMYVFNRGLNWHPTFTKLKILVLCKWFVAAEFNALSWFLHNAPLLEKLTPIPPKVHNNLMKIEESCVPSGKTSAFGHLKLVEIICKEVDVMVLGSLKILIANGIPLEKISVHCSDHELSVDSNYYICAAVNM